MKRRKNQVASFFIWRKLEHKNTIRFFRNPIQQTPKVIENSLDQVKHSTLSLVCLGAWEFARIQQPFVNGLPVQWIVDQIGLDMQNISDICVSKNVKDSGSLTRRNSKMVRNYVFYWGGFLWGKFIWVNYLTCCMSGLGCAYQQFRLLYCALEKLRSYEFRSYV